MWQRYRRFLEAPPTLTVEWHDPPTGARGWLVVNSLRGGASGGGTRMRAGLTREEVVYLAKCMEMKFAFSGPPIGGAKSGIDFDPADPRRHEVLGRWFRAIRPFLATCYGTGGDMNVDEQRDVVPLCRALDLKHPQEGVVRGHLGLSGDRLDAALDALGRGLEGRVGAPMGVEGTALTVSDLVTGWGTAQATARLLARRGESLDGKRVLVEGFGNVGGAAALYLARAGARVVGIVDADRALVTDAGLDAGDVADLVARRRGGAIPEHPCRGNGETRDRVWAIPADVFVPAAAGGTVDRRRLDDLDRAGVQTIVSGANHPFHEGYLGDTSLEEEADARFEVIPDVVGSMGMARAFHHLMTRGADDGVWTPDPGTVFDAVASAVEDAVDRVVDAAGGGERGLMAAAIGLALEESLDGSGG